MVKIDFTAIPDTSGIYFFYNSRGELIYVGKATSLKDRVSSYFSNGKKTSRPIEQMIHYVDDVKWKETDSVLEAIILEGEYIKKFRPKYNVDWRDDKSWNYICVTKDVFPRVITVRQHEINNSKFKIQNSKFIFGPYPGLNTRQTMKLLHRLFYISTCQKTLKQGKPCFYYQIGRCLGVCTGEITSKEYKEKVIRPLTTFLRGNKKGVIRQLEKKMREEAEQENFEEAGRIRNQIESLQRIQDIALLNKTFVEDSSSKIQHSTFNISRIEGYDISNLGTSGMVGSMVVFDANAPVKSEYRKFNIKTVEGQSDVDCLEEILRRRLSRMGTQISAENWPKPDVILVDGGKPQVNAVCKTIKEKSLSIPVVGIAKGPERKKNDILLGSKEREFVKWVYQNTKLLIRVRDEAHRFAINFQRSKRKI